MTRKQLISDSMTYKFAVSANRFLNNKFIYNPRTKFPTKIQKIYDSTKKYLINTSYKVNNDEYGLAGEAFLFDRKLIFSFGGTMGNGGIPWKDLRESIKIYGGIESDQSPYAINFIKQTKAKLNINKYDSVYATGFSLGGAIAEECYFHGDVDKVIKFDAIDKLVLSHRNEPDYNIISIRAGFNLLTGFCNDNAGIKIEGENCNYNEVSQPILSFISAKSHDDLVIGTCTIDEGIIV